MSLTAAPGLIATARDRQIRMLAAMQARDVAAVVELLAEGPRYAFTPQRAYRILVLAAPPVPPSDLSDPVQAALLIDYLATAGAADPVEHVLVYVGRMHQPPGYPHVFHTREGGHAVIADIDVLAYRIEAES